MDVRDPCLLCVAPRQRQHLVGHVETVCSAARADALRGQDDVDAPARAEVEDDIPFAELRHRGGVTAAERRKRRCVRQLAALLGRVEGLTE
jgi:hypothetical protein